MFFFTLLSEKELIVCLFIRLIHCMEDESFFKKLLICKKKYIAWMNLVSLLKTETNVEFAISQEALDTWLPPH